MSGANIEFQNESSLVPLKALQDRMEAEDLMQLETLAASPHLAGAEAAAGVLLGHARQTKALGKGESLFGGIVERRMKEENHSALRMQEAQGNRVADASGAPNNQQMLEQLESEWKSVHALHDEVSGLKADIQLGKIPGEPQVCLECRSHHAHSSHFVEKIYK
jgi:hypothetical protein